MARRIDQRLEIFVRFVGLDLNALTDGDWLNLRADIARFLDDRQTNRRQRDRLPLSGHVEGEPTTATIAADTLVKLQSEARVVCRDVIRQRQEMNRELDHSPGAPPTQPAAAGTAMSPREVAMHLDVMPSGAHDARPRLHVNGRFRDVFLAIADIVLWREFSTAVRACEQCGRCFVASRADSRFCGRTCLQRAWWASEKGQAKLKAIYDDNNWTFAPPPGVKRTRRSLQIATKARTRGMRWAQLPEAERKTAHRSARRKKPTAGR